MKLKASVRSIGKGFSLAKIRHEGNIPAVIYSKNRDTETIQVSASEFESILRQLERGHLPNTVFELEVGGTTKKAIVKDIQYHKTTYAILHLDFYELQEDQEVTINVPLHFKNVGECSGIKLGGFLRQIKRHVKVRCLPKNIPSEFSLDIKEMGLKQAKRIKDLVFPEGVQSMFGKEEVVVVIAK